MSLLDKAKAVKGRRKLRPCTEEDIELTMAWLRGDITQAQVRAALGTHSGMTVYVYLTRIMHVMYQQGYLKPGVPPEKE